MMREAPSMFAVVLSGAMLAGGATGCSSKSAPAAPSTGDASSVDAPTPSGDTSGAGHGEGRPQIADAVGQLDGAPSTALPALPPLTNVVATPRDDSVGIDFDPFDDAVDYRVYPLPADGDVTVNVDGSFNVKNAIYRCAGLRQSFDVANNLNSNGGLTPQSADGTGLFTSDGNGYAWKTQIPTTPTLGYVYTTAAPDRVPVFALAGYTLEYELGWSESRLKIYTTDATERQTLIASRWRDDGVVFYVPSAASDATATIYRSQTAEPQAGKSYTQHVQYYFGDADLATHAKDTTPPAPAFQVLKAAAAGTAPLMAVMYQPLDNHIELAVGNERFKRAANQGPGPLWHLEWSGLTKPTVLVVEALASGCPFQGFLSATHLEAPPHQTFYTLDELQKASATGEVFINGQYDAPGSPAAAAGPHGLPSGGTAPILTSTTMSPRAIARSFVSVAPAPHDPAAWDWYQGFSVGTDFGAVTTMPRAGALCPPGSQPSVCGRWLSPTFDFSAYNLDGDATQVFTYGYFLGQLWEAFDDTGSDVTGKVRFTALQMAKVDADPTKFLHATMSVDIVSTDRRYPQLIISDQPAPVQEGLATPSNNTLLFQAIGGPPTRIELQAIHGLVNGHSWDVNNQAPAHVLVRPDFSNGAASVIAPDEAIDHHMGVDRMTRFDVYVSSERAYFFLDGAPAGCTEYPTGFSLGGPVAVTIGDVLYHEGAGDELVCAYQKPYPFLHAHQCTETKRHFDDVGFKSGLPAPAWNEAIFPCGAY
jgi:hypothetical protein